MIGSDSIGSSINMQGTAIYVYETSRKCNQPLVLRMKGCRSASTGVIRFSGFKFRHRSKRSTNKSNSFISASFIPLTFAMSLVLRSRTGLVKLTIRTISYIKVSLLILVLCCSLQRTYYLSCHLVLFYTPKIEQIIKMKARKFSFA